MFFKDDNILDKIPEPMLDKQSHNLKSYQKVTKNQEENKQEFQKTIEQKQQESIEKRERLQKIEEVKQELIKKHIPNTFENKRINIENHTQMKKRIQYANEKLEYASFLDRFLATLIDMFIILIPLGIAEIISTLINQKIIFNNILFEWILPLIITFIFWIKLGGTPGKLIMKIYVVNENNGRYIDIKQSIFRYMGYFISTVIFFIGFIWIIFDDKKQAWHDKIAGTVVVRKKVEQVDFLNN